MKALISLALLIGAYLLAKAIFGEFKAQQNKSNPQQQQNAAPSVMEGLPPELEASLAQAQSQGAPALRKWLQQYGHQARDPRLADIQLDYVVLVSRTNPQEARQLFQAVKRRTPATSPVHERVKRLEKTYGN